MMSTHNNAPVIVPPPTRFVPQDNLRIVDSVNKALRGDLRVVSHASGRCLQAVREVIEDAFDMKPYDLYKVYVTERVQRNPGDSPEPWARDAERSLRNRGMVVPFEERMPGDIVFQWRSARTPSGNWYGHVGILMHGDMVFENINPKYRPTAFSRQMLSLSPLESWPLGISSTIRFDLGANKVQT